MFQLIAVEFMSLDGVMQSPGRADEDTTGGFSHGGWASSRMADDPDAAAAAMGGSEPTAAMLFGRRTYVDLVGHWLTTSDPNPFADILRATPKYVASRDEATTLDHPHSTLLAGEAAETVANLKSTGDGDLIMLGSASLLHTLQEADLVDGYIVTMLPVILGSGLPLFAPNSAYADLQLTRGVVSPKGAFIAEYRRR